MTLEQYTKKQREKIGMTQKQLADVLGLATVQYISNNERGESTYSVAYFGALSKWLDIPMSTMIKMRVRDFTAKLKREVGEV